MIHGPIDLFAARILVLDDVTADARLAQAMLCGAGYTHVDVVTRAADGLELHRNNPYDLVVLDMLMPDIDGFEVMQRMRDIDGAAFIPVLAVTSDPSLASRALETGARDFVDKPLRMAEVLARARNIIEVGLSLKHLRHTGAALEKALHERTSTLQESEALFRLFAQHIPEAIFIRGVQERTYKYFNPAFERLVGRPLCIGEGIDVALESLHPDDRPGVHDAIDALPFGGMKREMRFVHPDGSVRWAFAKTFPIESQGRLPWVGGVLQDITERKATEQALRETESRFRALVEQSIAGIYVVDQGRFSYANPRMCQMLGYSAEELKSLDTEELVIPEDRPVLFQNRARRAAGDPGAMAAVYRLRRKDGSILHLGVDGKLLVIDGREVILGVGQDITESARARELLREAEIQYRALVEQSLVGIYIMANNRIVYANPMLCELLGYTGAELTGMHAKQIIIAEDHAVIGARLESRRLGETGSISTQCHARCRDGRVVHLSIESKVLELGGRKAAVGVVQDITERESAARALRDSEEKYRLLWETTRDANQRLRVLSKRVLDIQEQERRAISMELHDDIGQSLLALNMGLHRIKARGRDGGADVIDNCIRVSEAMQEKLREMSVQLHPPQLEQLGLPDALRWLVNRQKSLTGLSISCRFGFSGRLAPEVESACYRICQEALNNSTRHSAANMIVVELDDDAESLILTVRDDGIGFDEAGKRKEALLRGSLGLISMEERARLAGGRLRMRTAPGHGTSVCAYFPRGPRTHAHAVAATGAE